MENLLVSICIPAYNSRKYIGETLHSIRQQSYHSWELVIVEDGSNDGTKTIAEKFGRQVSNRVVYIRNGETKGPAYSRNVGANNTTGKWIAFLDSDDLWAQNHLSSLIDTAVAYPDCDLIHSGVNVFDSQTGSTIFSESYDPVIIERFPTSLFDRSYGFQPSQTIVSRKLFEATGGFDEKVRFGVEDLEMWFKCAKAEFKFANSKENTCFYRKHTNALSTNGLNLALGSAEIYEMYADWKAIPKKSSIPDYGTLLVFCSKDGQAE